MSTLNVSNITDGTTTVGTSYVVNGSAKAWARHTSVTTTAIVDSFNIASIVDSGVGETTFNLSNAMSNANYAVMATAGRTSGSNPGECWIYSGNMTASGAYQVETLAQGDLSYQDQDYVAHSVYGELA